MPVETYAVLWRIAECGLCDTVEAELVRQGWVVEIRSLRALVNPACKGDHDREAMAQIVMQDMAAPLVRVGGVFRTAEEILRAGRDTERRAAE